MGPCSGATPCPRSLWKAREQAGTGEDKSHNARVTEARNQERELIHVMGLYVDLQGEWLHNTILSPPGSK